jgi:hypothetical protein
LIVETSLAPGTFGTAIRNLPERGAGEWMWG